MTVICALFLALQWLMVINAAPAERQVAYNRYFVIRVIPKDNRQLQALKQLEQNPNNQLDFWARPSVIGNPVDIMVPPPEMSVWKRLKDLLTSKHLTYQIVVPNVQWAIDTEMFQASANGEEEKDIVGKFVGHDQITNWLKKMANENSDIAQTAVCGSTVEGREISLIKIGKDTNKPIIWLDAGIHAREWLTQATAVYIINKLLTKRTDNKVQDMLSKYRFFIAPDMNPDGYEYSRRYNRMWRKNRKNNRYRRCMGVDLNRNWGYHFGESGVIWDPCHDTYPGLKAFSEPETQTVSEYIKRHASDIALYMSLHSYSQMWFTPWAYTSQQPLDKHEMTKMAKIGANALKAVNGRLFSVGTPPSLLYAAAGGSYDWTKGVAGIKYSYTLELYPSRFNLFQQGFIVKESEIWKSGEEIWAGLVATAKAVYFSPTPFRLNTPKE